jgi:histidine ammonia-lyase
MGTNAALLAKTVVENAWQVMAIHFMALVQAVDFLKIEEQLSSQTRETYREIRAIFPAFTEDAPLYGAVKKIEEYLKNKNIEQI